MMEKKIREFSYPYFKFRDKATCSGGLKSWFDLCIDIERR